MGRSRASNSHFARRPDVLSARCQRTLPKRPSMFAPQVKMRTRGAAFRVTFGDSREPHSPLVGGNTLAAMLETARPDNPQDSGGWQAPRPRENCCLAPPPALAPSPRNVLQRVPPEEPASPLPWPVAEVGTASGTHGRKLGGHRRSTRIRLNPGKSDQTFHRRRGDEAQTSTQPACRHDLRLRNGVLAERRTIRWQKNGGANHRRRYARRPRLFAKLTGGT
jgi:hypothetical protein